MPRYFKSTANKPGGGVRKGYRRGGRNLRDEEARVIGVQDNAADELRRVRARRPHDAAERRDRRDQLARVGSRERNARDEMARLRGYQYGGAIGRQGAAMGPAINRRIAAAGAGPNSPLRYTAPAINYMGGFSPRTPRGNRYQYGGAIERQAAALGPSISAEQLVALLENPSWQAVSTAQARGESAPDYGPGSGSTRGDEHIFGALSGYQYGGAIGRQAAAFRPPINVNPVAIASQLPAFTRGGSHIPKHPGDTRRDRTAAWHRLYGSGGGRLGFKTGGRIPSKKGTKFI